MLRPSTYNIVTEIKKDDFVMIQGYSKNIIRVDKELAEILTGGNGELRKLKKAILNSLFDQGFLFDGSAEDEKKLFLKFVNKIFANHCQHYVNNLTIIPSMSCNLACSYCFEKHALSNSNKVIDISMSKEQVDKIFSIFIKDVCKNKINENSVVALYGGEPLLNKNLRIVEYIVEKAAELNLRVSATSNLTEMESFKHLLSEKKLFHIVTTLDGIESIHNERRVYKNGKGTFHTIVKNIDLALSKNVKVQLGINLDRENIAYLKDFISFVSEKAWDQNPLFEIMYSPIHESVNKEGRIEKNGKIISRTEMCELLSDIIGKEKAYKLRYNYLTPYILKSKELNDFNVAKCGAVYRNYIFDNSHNVFNCSSLLGLSRFKVGQYNTKLSLKTKYLDEFWRGPQINNERCISCEYSLYCGGGPCKILMESNDYATKYCDEYKNDFDYFIKTKVYPEVQNLEIIKFKDVAHV